MPLEDGEFDGNSIQRISNAVRAVERMQANGQQFGRGDAGNKAKPSNAVMITGGRNGYGLYPGRYVRLADHTKQNVLERWERLTENDRDCYLIVGHVTVNINDVFDTTLCSIITETDDEIPVFLFSESNYGYYNSGQGALTQVVWQNDTDPRCTGQGTISVNRRWNVLTGTNLLLKEYGHNPLTAGGWYIVGEAIVFSVGPPTGGYNSGPYDTAEEAAEWF